MFFFFIKQNLFLTYLFSLLSYFGLLQLFSNVMYRVNEPCTHSFFIHGRYLEFWIVSDFSPDAVYHAQIHPPLQRIDQNREGARFMWFRIHTGFLHSYISK